MKKIIPMLILSLLASCSRDKGDSLENKSTGLKKPKVITIVEADGYKRVINLEYEGNNIKTVSPYPSQFIYENAKLVEFKKNPIHSEKYYYDNLGRLNQVSEDESGYKGMFTYNSGSNKINSGKFYRFQNLLNQTDYTYDSNDNIIKITYPKIDQYTSRTPLVITYDNKKNPFTNVNFELARLLDDDLLSYGCYTNSKNNCLTVSGTVFNAGSGSYGEATYSYEYDADGFPIKMLKRDPKGITTTTYQY